MERVRKSNDVTYCLYGGYESAHNGAGGNMLNPHHKKCTIYANSNKSESPDGVHSALNWMTSLNKFSIYRLPVVTLSELVPVKPVVYIAL